MTKLHRCPECGRFLRLAYGWDNDYMCLVGKCKRCGIFVVLEEFRREAEDI